MVALLLRENAVKAPAFGFKSVDTGLALFVIEFIRLTDRDAIKRTWDIFWQGTRSRVRWRLTERGFVVVSCIWAAHASARSGRGDVHGDRNRERARAWSGDETSQAAIDGVQHIPIAQMFTQSSEHKAEATLDDKVDFDEDVEVSRQPTEKACSESLSTP